MESNWQHQNSGTSGPPVEVGEPWPMDENDQLVRELWADTVSEYTVNGRTDFENASNAVGPNNGTLATSTGSATGSQGGLLLTFANIAPEQYQSLNLVAANVYFYVQQRGTALSNGDFKLGINLQGEKLEKFSSAANFNNLSSPRNYNILADLNGSFERLNTLTAWVEHFAQLAELHVGEIDAVRLRLVFEK